MDPESQWQTMLRLTGGTDAVDFSRVPPDTRMFLRGLSERMGTEPIPDAGVWGKDQFIAFATRNQDLMRAKMGGGQPGGPTMQFNPNGGPGGFNAPPGGFNMQPGGFGGPGGGGMRMMTDEEITRAFQQGDRDQDGKLSQQEASDRTRQNWNEIDTNRDGFVDLDEYRVYVHRRQGGPVQGGPGGGDPRNGDGGGDPRNGGGYGRKAEDFSNVGIRYGKLPPGLPEWFTEYDQDKDGQINMYEWRTVGGKTLAEFRELDANGDGFIAPQELLHVTASKAEFERLMAIQSGETPPPQGRGGKSGGSLGNGPSLGNGSFPSRGSGGEKGGPSAGPGERPERGERPGGKGGEKGGEKGDRKSFMFGGKKGN
jgi:hypothetical protein